MLFIFSAFPAPKAIAQTKNKMGDYEGVVKLIKDKSFKEALDSLEDKKKSEGNKADRLALKGFLYAQIGERKEKEKVRRTHFYKGKYYAELAIEEDPDHAFAHFAKAMALGRILQNAAPQEKLRYAKVIKQEAEKAIENDPSLAGPHHILGRWHLNIADMPSIQRWSVDFFLSELPDASFEKALEHFQKAIELEPREAVHYYGKAITYEAMDEPEKAEELIRKALKMAQKIGDREIQEKCEEFLQD